MHFIRCISQTSGNAFYNMALDEAITEAVRKHISPPTLRFYTWDMPSVSIGYFQKSSEVDMAYCRNKNYPIVRRLTGGRAILHDSELTYSFSSPADFSLCKGTLLESYTVISIALVRALLNTGIEAEASYVKKRSNDHRNPSCFKTVSFGEITVDSKKIIGSAQKRYKDGFLQHGSILIDHNAEELCSVLNGSSIKEFNGIGSLRNALPNINLHDLELTIKEAFEHVLNVKLIDDQPTKYELSHAMELEAEKYSTMEWNFKR